jgi:hypothetical protein
VPYLAGAFGGLLTVRIAPTPAIEIAPLWGFGCGVVTGCAMGVLAAFAGCPLGSGRLTAVGPSGWQTALVTALEVGVAAAVTAGVMNWLWLRREPAVAGGSDGAAAWAEGPDEVINEGVDDSGHRIYLDPWADDEDGEQGTASPPGPASLP